LDTLFQKKRKEKKRKERNYMKNNTAPGPDGFTVKKI
jgi:hypothetical protein